MFFVARSNDSFNFPLGLIKYTDIVNRKELGQQLNQSGSSHIHAFFFILCAILLAFFFFFFFVQS